MLFVQKARPGDFLLNENCAGLSRDTVVLAGGHQLGAGRVLGKVTSSGLYGPYTPDSETGLETAVAILFAAADTTRGEANALVIARHAAVKAPALDWGDADELAIAEGKAQLGAAFIVVR